MNRSISVSSNDTKLIDSVKSQEDELIDRDIILESSYTNYEYTKFQELKPEMMAEAIANAEKTASQFAENRVSSRLTRAMSHIRKRYAWYQPSPIR